MDENGTMLLLFPFLAMHLTTTNLLMILHERTNDGAMPQTNQTKMG